MKKFLTIIFVSVFALSCKHHKNPINLGLKKELEEIFFKDQVYRELLDENVSNKKLEEIAEKLKLFPQYLKNNVLALIMKQDAENIFRVEKIIEKYGYPGKTLVGEPENETTWFVIQHSNKIEKYLPLIKKASENGEIKFTNYAMMLDRYLMEKGKEQIYGTQGYGSHGKRDDGTEFSFDVIWPIKNPEKVNELRKKAGFTQTIEDNAKDLYGKDFQYKVYTLEEAKKLQAQ